MLFRSLLPVADEHHMFQLMNALVSVPSLSDRKRVNLASIIRSLFGFETLVFFPYSRLK